tara:strand:+ start:551 stop:757 length:207 start_codon:yes stop_codon:yes gene_type:complete
MNHSREQLIDALMGEYVSFIEDGYEEDLDMTEEEYHKWLHTLSVERLIEETCCDDVYLTLDDFVYGYS